MELQEPKNYEECVKISEEPGCVFCKWKNERMQGNSKKYCNKLLEFIGQEVYKTLQ